MVVFLSSNLGEGDVELLLETLLSHSVSNVLFVNVS